MVVAGLVHAGSPQGALAGRLLAGSALAGPEHVPAGEMKISVVSEAGPVDLGRRRPLEGVVPLQVAGGALLGCGFESQQGLECPAVHDAMTGVALRLKAQ